MKSRFIYFSLPVLIVSIALFFSLGCDKDDDPTPPDNNGNNGGGSVYGTMTDNRDGTEYKTIEIGTQIWMAENLAYLPQVSDLEDIAILQPRYYVYDYDGTNVEEAKETENYQIYGVLYNWPAAINLPEEDLFGSFSNERGVCPQGWHLPSDYDLDILKDYLYDNEYIDDVDTLGFAKALSAQSHWKESAEEGAVGNDLSANNQTYFSALPSGRMINAQFLNIGEYTSWWTTSSAPNWGHIRTGLGISYNSPNINPYAQSESSGALPVRCLKYGD